MKKKIVDKYHYPGRNRGTACQSLSLIINLVSNTRWPNQVKSGQVKQNLTQIDSLANDLISNF